MTEEKQPLGKVVSKTREELQEEYDEYLLLTGEWYDNISYANDKMEEIEKIFKERGWGKP